jgi:hypothetical protein
VTKTRYVFSNGEQTTSRLDALLYFKRHRDLTVVERDPDGVEIDLTELWRKVLDEHGYGGER